MTGILMLCFLAMAIYSFADLRREKKHDDVLFPFCQLRRDIMRFLYENVVEKPGSLSKEEYLSVRRLLDMVSQTIHNYNRHKTVMFDLRKAIKCIREYRHTLKQMPSVDITEHAEIQDFHRRFMGLLAVAFIAYTPLIRFEIVLRLFAVACRVGKTRVHYAVKIASDARKTERRHGLIANGASA